MSADLIILRTQHADKRQVPVSLGKIKPVADHEKVRNAEPDVVGLHRFRPPRFFLQQRWSHRVSAHSEDFTDQEAVAAIIRITQGNMRLIDRLMKQVERVLTANQLTVVTNEVVETARKNLIIGFE